MPAPEALMTPEEEINQLEAAFALPYDIKATGASMIAAAGGELDLSKEEPAKFDEVPSINMFYTNTRTKRG